MNITIKIELTPDMTEKKLKKLLDVLSKYGLTPYHPDK